MPFSWKRPSVGRRELEVDVKSKQQNRRSLYFAAVATLLLLPSVGLAEAEDPELDPMIPVGFLIIRSTPNYAEALRVAERAASQVDIPLDLRGLVYDPAHGLTWPAEVCEKDPLYPFPCYVARGRFDPGVYLSVERSDAYATFTAGFFIVIAASGEPGSSELESALARVQPAYPDAYIKREKVYHGCMH